MFHIGLFDKEDLEKEKKLIESFRKIKHEMNDHLDAINENTDEINSNFDFVLHLETMINKLNERLDEVEMKVNRLSGQKTMTPEDFKNIVLNNQEEEIFLMLYSRSGDLLTYKDISRSLGITEESARKAVADMTSKGIPIVKKYFDSKVFLILDADFRNLQAKENVLNI